ncbi:hypothetical protein SARC_12197 [Sphaeroforma arctica JP610]|uniref:Uncharacterized protein n=1 Tax=Sphaeroforma arctica JP610 TaxID=667725 RepID=A0A0L0FET0_9EUKA|nr:hypothetical protein SARC_12197 [Sphaeroforma arctica JP610]KNC75277.1 hypothetical protein SARC_12197 [Sphaeroforma arctica JP610]|eukprot:XP_014149179.1 hypothetical protein SARC_12197 [Sphaeroforma arctica JP610]
MQSITNALVRASKAASNQELAEIKTHSHMIKDLDTNIGMDSVDSVDLSDYDSGSPSDDGEDKLSAVHHRQPASRRSSILQTNHPGLIRNTSRVSFGRRVSVCETFAPNVYDRTAATSEVDSTSTDMLDIAYWLDNFKINEMDVHPSSLENTLIYMPNA